MGKKESTAFGGYILILLAGVLWGFIGLFVKQLEAAGSTPDLTALLRMTFAFLLFLPFCVLRLGWRKMCPGLRDLGFCALQGLVCFGLFNLFYSKAVVLTGVSVAAVLMYTAPVFTLLISCLLFGEPFTPRKGAAVLLNIAGCALTAVGGKPDLAALSLPGILAGVGAGFCYALTPVFGRFGTKRMDSGVLTLYSFLFAALFLLLRLVLTGGRAPVLSGRLLLWGLLFGLIPTVCAYFLYYRGISRITETSRVPVLASVETVVAAVIGMGLYRDALGVWGVLGVLMVLASILVLHLRLPKMTRKNPSADK